MRRTIRITSILILTALGMASSAEAQRGSSHLVINGETRIVDDNGSRRLEIRSRGPVEFSDAGDWVESVGNGGVFEVEERDGGERRIEFRPGGVRYYVNDRERPLDAGGRAWARGHILRAVRESGIGAERRVARIRARSGVNGVLQEIAQMMRAEFPGRSLSGLGGIESGGDAAQFILLGADTVQVCTGVMKFGYDCVKPMCDELLVFMAKHNFATIADFKGSSLDYFTTHADLVRRQAERKAGQKAAAAPAQKIVAADGDWSGDSFVQQSNDLARG